MESARNEYDNIAERLVLQHPDVSLGKMMSSPGIKCNGKVMAFFGKDGMGFRLGADFDFASVDIRNPQPLSPFKTKPPLKGWYIVAADEQDKWHVLAEHALAFTRSL